MAVTLQQIAEAAGVSRGTVDRALNHRGRIKPEVAERICKIAKEMGYRPNRAGRALSMSRRYVTVGVVAQAVESPFIKKVLEGVREAKEEIEQLGGKVIVKELRSWDAQKAVEAMYELKEAGCGGIAVVPVDDERLRLAIDKLAEEKIPVVTFNSDIEKSKRLCFIGADAKQSGRTAGGLMAEIVPKGGKVLVISGYPTNYTHQSKAGSFCEELAACREDVEILGIEYAFDGEQAAQVITEDVLEEYPDLSGIYTAASGAQGVCEALAQTGMSGRVKVISNDLTEQNIRCLREGKIQFLLGQDSFRQGYEPVLLLFQKLFDGKEPGEEFLYTDILIKTKYNL